MCGIVGAIAKRNIVPVLIEGLKRLEYRGYDSAGVAVLDGMAAGSRATLRRVRRTGRVAELEKLAGSQGLAGVPGIAHTRWPTHGAPLLLGLGEGENFAASDTSALIQVTQRVVYLEDGDCAELTLDGVCISDSGGKAVSRPVHMSQLTADAVELGHYRHYMQKEIFEQPMAVANTLEMVTGARSVSPQLFGAEAEGIFRDVDSVLILACGTSYHAGMVARYC